jgi:hypothetical protein
VMLEYSKARRVEPPRKSLLVSCASTCSTADDMQSVTTHSVYHEGVAHMWSWRCVIQFVSHTHDTRY